MSTCVYPSEVVELLYALTADTCREGPKKSRDWQRLISIIQRDASAVHEVTESGETALHLAASHFKPDYVGLLLARGANPNVRNLGLGVTPMYNAVCGCYHLSEHWPGNVDENDHHLMVKLFEMLVRGGADVDCASLDEDWVENMTPLYLAVGQGMPSVTAALIDLGATVGWEGGSFPPESDGSVLFLAADRAVRHGLWKTFEVLLEKGRFDRVSHSSKRAFKLYCEALWEQNNDRDRNLGRGMLEKHGLWPNTFDGRGQP